jgi:type I restriction enzyme, R subunit
MKLIRATEVVKASVQYQGTVDTVGAIKGKSGKAVKDGGVPPRKISVHEMISEIREKFEITDEEALYIKEVTEKKTNDPEIRTTVQAHKQDRIYLEGAFQTQVNGQIQSAYAKRGRYDELADEKYIDVGAIFDIMAVKVVQQHLAFAA